MCSSRDRTIQIAKPALARFAYDGNGWRSTGPSAKQVSIKVARRICVTTSYRQRRLHRRGISILPLHWFNRACLNVQNAALSRSRTVSAATPTWLRRIRSGGGREARKAAPPANRRLSRHYWPSEQRTRSGRHHRPCRICVRMDAPRRGAAKRSVARNQHRSAMFAHLAHRLH